MEGEGRLERPTSHVTVSVRGLPLVSHRNLLYLQLVRLTLFQLSYSPGSDAVVSNSIRSEPRFAKLSPFRETAPDLNRVQIDNKSIALTNELACTLNSMRLSTDNNPPSCWMSMG